MQRDFHSIVSPGYYDDKNNEEIPAFTTAGASENHEILLQNSTFSKFITPKILELYEENPENEKNKEKTEEFLVFSMIFH